MFNWILISFMIVIYVNRVESYLSVYLTTAKDVDFLLVSNEIKPFELKDYMNVFRYVITLSNAKANWNLINNTDKFDAKNI